jgi:hypothetical protein
MPAQDNEATEGSPAEEIACVVEHPLVHTVDQ